MKISTYILENDLEKLYKFLERKITTPPVVYFNTQISDINFTKEVVNVHINYNDYVRIKDQQN
jgi:hypothetical protein